jgi:hypothetical protein
MSSQASQILETVGALLKDGGQVLGLISSEIDMQASLKTQREEADRETERLIELEEALEMRNQEFLGKETQLLKEKEEHDLRVAALDARIAAHNNSIQAVVLEIIEPELLHLHVSKLVCFYLDLIIKISLFD